MTTRERDWDGWIAGWRVGDDPPPRIDVNELRRRAARYRWRLIGVVVLEVVTSILTLAFVTFASIQCPFGYSGLWIAAIWIYAALVAAYAIRQRRGIWRPAAESTEAFIDLTRRRLVHQLRTTALVLAFTIVIGFAVATRVVWEITQRPGHSTDSARTGTWIAAVALLTVYAAGSLWVRRRAKYQLRQVDALSRDPWADDRPRETGGR
jgi:hypothetical protein